MYWLNEFSFRYRSKKVLNKYHSGELDGGTLSPKKYRELLIVSGETVKKADVAAAKLHLEKKRVE